MSISVLMIRAGEDDDIAEQLTALDEHSEILSVSFRNDNNEPLWVVTTRARPGDPVRSFQELTATLDDKMRLVQATIEEYVDYRVAQGDERALEVKRMIGRLSQETMP